MKLWLGPDIYQHILTLLAVLRCDTTSRLHGIGKGASLKKYQTNNTFREQAKVLHTHSASTHDVTCVGDIALVIVYNGRSTDTLASLRHQRFREKVASSANHVHPLTQPPTPGAAKYHSRYACIPSIPRMEGICWWTSPDRVRVHGSCVMMDLCHCQHH